MLRLRPKVKIPPSVAHYWSQQPWNLQDELQQVAFRTETKKLWETFSVMDSFEFNTIQDVIKELNECNRLLEGSIEQLQKDMSYI